MLTYDPLITAYVLFVAALLGLVTGSFVNCWAWRYLAGESIVNGRSHCTSCGHELSARDLVPVFSWLASKGRCRYCGAKVSARYPLTELVTALVFVGIVAVYGLSIETVELLVFASVLLFLSLTDLDEFLIPNGCIIVALVVRVTYMAVAFAMGDMNVDDIVFYVGSAFGMGLCLLVLVLVADRLFKRSSMGGGDLKLYFVAGLYFGWQQGLFLIVLSCIAGILATLVAMALVPGSRSESEPDSGEPDEEALETPTETAAPEAATLQTPPSEAATPEPPASEPPASEAASSDNPPSLMGQLIPFGPSIAFSCVVTMLVGQPFVSWYLSLVAL